MSYETQLKVGRKTRPALRETGCWSVADGVYTMQTTASNGEEVDASDPIYVNRLPGREGGRRPARAARIEGRRAGLHGAAQAARLRLPN